MSSTLGGSSLGYIEERVDLLSLQGLYSDSTLVLEKYRPDTICAVLRI
jgi:hypothetical protein